MNLKELIKEQGGVKKLSEALGYTPQYIYQLVRGLNVPGGILWDIKRKYPEFDLNSLYVDKT